MWTPIEVGVTAKTDLEDPWESLQNQPLTLKLFNKEKVVKWQSKHTKTSCGDTRLFTLLNICNQYQLSIALKVLKICWGSANGEPKTINQRVSILNQCSAVSVASCAFPPTFKFTCSNISLNLS